MLPDRPTLTLRGIQIHQGLIDREEQEVMVEALREVARVAPPFSPDTPYGTPMSVRMTSAGRYGWYSDRTGYRYTAQHPNGAQWPPIPEAVLRVWRQLIDAKRGPDCCLINF